MTKPRHIPALALLTLLALALTGCNSRPMTHAWDEPDHGLLYRGPGQARSLALDADMQWALVAARPTRVDPWYSGRNDAVDSVYYGERYPIYETTSTVSRDQQSITGGRVSDRFNQTTYRRRVYRTLR